MPQAIHAIAGRSTTKDNHGYVMVWWPDHPDVHSNGYVPRSRLVMENKLGRPLQSKEHVYHVNNNPADDNPENLTLDPPHKLPVLTCPVCEKQFQQKNSRIRYCTPECAGVSMRRCKHPSAEMLQWYVWDKPTEDVGAHFGVSGKAVEKWCKKLGIPKPPRGYWAKVHAGKIKHKNPHKRPKENGASDVL